MNNSNVVISMLPEPVRSRYSCTAVDSSESQPDRENATLIVSMILLCNTTMIDHMLLI